MAQWQVVGHCAHVSTVTEHGRATVMLYQGDVIPGDIPAEQLRHLLSVGLIKEVGWEPAPPPAPAQPEPVTAPPADVAVGDYEHPDRVAARAKLPKQGLPGQPEAKAVWVEAAVRAGYDYAAASASTKNDLMALLKG